MTAYDQGYDAFVRMLTSYVVPENPYSPLLKQSHKKWEQGFWNTMYEWKMSLTPKEICNMARALNGLPQTD